MNTTWIAFVAHPLRSRMASVLAENAQLKAENAQLRAENWRLRDEQAAWWNAGRAQAARQFGAVNDLLRQQVAGHRADLARYANEPTRKSGGERR